MSTVIYNVEPAEIDLVFIQNDTIDISFLVKKNAVELNMAGMQLDMEVRTCDVSLTLIRSFSSAGSDPKITISTTAFNVKDTGFVATGKYNYDIQLTDGTDVSTIMKGSLIVEGEVTI
jgi:hypothetical protein